MQYNTNLSYSKYKKYDLKTLWTNFKDVSLWPSIEGYKDERIFEERIDWNNFENNVKHFMSTYQLLICNNVFYLYNARVNFMDKTKKSYYGSLLQAPPYYDITILPRSKTMINNKYKNFIKKCDSLLSTDDINQMISCIE